MNDFNEAVNLINDIRADARNAKLGSGNKNVFDDLEKLINYISNSKVKKEDAFKRMNKSISDLEELRKKENSGCQNKMIYQIYKENMMSKEKRFNEITNTITKAKNDGLKTSVDRREITLDNVEILLKSIASGQID